MNRAGRARCSTSSTISRDRFPGNVDDYETLLTENRIWKQRTVGIGVVSPERAMALGLHGADASRLGRAVGPAQEAAVRGVRPDGRSTFPSARTATATTAISSASRRCGSRTGIIKQCVDWLRANPGPVIVADHKIAPPSREDMKTNMEELIHHFKLFTEGMHVPPGEAYAAIEHPKGEFGIYMVSDGANKPYRVKIRAPGFAHLAALDEMARGHMIADAVAIIGTLDIVFGEIDR